MMDLLSDERLAAVVLLFGGALGLLVAIMAGAGSALTPGMVAPGRRALAHWLPIAVTATVCSLLGHTEMGIGIAFGTSVAALSCVTGFVVLAGVPDSVPLRAGRLWGMLPLPALLAFAIGFHGTVGPFESLLLATMGLLLLNVWLDHRHAGPWPAPDTEAPLSPPGSIAVGFRAIQFLLALALAAVAAWAVTRGAEQLSRQDVRYSTNALATTLLSVVLILPMVGTGVPLAAEGRAWIPLTALVGLVFLNLCALLPMVILLPNAVAWLAPYMPAIPATQPIAEPVLFPRMAWRLDALAAIILSLVFVPISSGRFKLDRQLAGGLIMGYGIYLLVVLIADMQG